MAHLLDLLTRRKLSAAAVGKDSLGSRRYSKCSARTGLMGWMLVSVRPMVPASCQLLTSDGVDHFEQVKSTADLKSWC